MDYNLALSTRMPCSAVCANEPASLYDGFILLRHQIHRYGLGSHVTSDLWRLVLEAGQLGRAKLTSFFPVIKADVKVTRKMVGKSSRSIAEALFKHLKPLHFELYRLFFWTLFLGICYAMYNQTMRGIFFL